MGTKLFAIPWEALAFDEDEKKFVLSVEKTTLETAPGFDKDNWPGRTPPLGRQLYNHCGLTPRWDERERL
jgi:hypothetical protein